VRGATPTRPTDTRPKPGCRRTSGRGNAGSGTLDAHDPTEETPMQTSDPSTPETMSQPMDTTTDDDGANGAWVDSPVDDATYDVLMALASKLEAIDTYQVYAEDGNADLWRDLARDERRHAERLFGELKQRIAGA
jgi:hypothetical protein